MRSSNDHLSRHLPGCRILWGDSDDFLALWTYDTGPRRTAMIFPRITQVLRGRPEDHADDMGDIIAARFCHYILRWQPDLQSVMVVETGPGGGGVEVWTTRTIDPEVWDSAVQALIPVHEIMHQRVGDYFRQEKPPAAATE